MNLRSMIATLLLMLTSTVGGQASGDISLDGYFKNFTVGYELPTVRYSDFEVDTPPLGSVTNRLRLNARWRPSANLSLTAAYDIGPVIQDPLLFRQAVTLAGTDPFYYRVDDLNPRVYPSDLEDLSSFAVIHNLDRLNLEWRTDRADFFVGRQAIAFGSARAVNPTDILAPYTYQTLDTEDRIGVDAVRARVPLGFMGELDAGYVFGGDFEFENSAAFLRLKFYVAQTDLALMTVAYRENLMLGFDLARAIGGAGFWLEAAQTFADALADEESGTAKDFFRATIGVDYSLGDNTYGFAEYHFNQAGGDDPADYIHGLTRTAYTDGSTYLMGRHYLIPGINHQLSPLVTAGAEVLWNLSDWSAYLAPSLEYNLAENVYLSGGALVGVGRSPVQEAGVGSEFGAYPDMFYSSFRVYF